MGEGHTSENKLTDTQRVNWAQPRTATFVNIAKGEMEKEKATRTTRWQGRVSWRELNIVLTVYLYIVCIVKANADPGHETHSNFMCTSFKTAIGQRDATIKWKMSCKQTDNDEQIVALKHRAFLLLFINVDDKKCQFCASACVWMCLRILRPEKNIFFYY